MNPPKRQKRVPPSSSTASRNLPRWVVFSPSELSLSGAGSPPTFLGLLWLVPAVLLAGAAYYYSNEVEALNASNFEPFFVADLPGKGKGLVAARDIQQGELLISESPLFTVPKSISGSPAALIAQLLQTVGPADRDAFFNLSYVHFPEGLDPEKHPDEVALAIFQTNAVAAGGDVGIFPRMARLNHGCSSAFNAVYSWRQREGALLVHALKNILRGQELLTTYTDTKRIRKERRSFLSQQYGFRCTCAVCSLGGAQSQSSDKRLTAISQYYGHFATWGSGRIDGVEAITTINKIWKLEDEEGYWSERGRLAADAAWIAVSHSDASAARLWAQLAIKWYTFELGADSDLVMEMQNTAVHPEQHPAWGSRELLTVGPPD
ncbi:hypothetical protein B0H10DRAFT_1791437 [Mycena sp. CBHHK59/15]|nr:hypothetical protein B0H10DRAFT_1791437 [Mycena sp. CBHHK59/15]